jgi:hypothetical protein
MLDHADKGARVDTVIERGVQRNRQSEQSNDPNGHPHRDEDETEFLMKFTMSKDACSKHSTGIRQQINMTPL